MNKKLSGKDVAKETLILTVAVAIIAAAVYFFLVPSHTSISSISGLGIVLTNFIPLPLSAMPSFSTPLSHSLTNSSASRISVSRCFFAPSSIP